MASSELTAIGRMMLKRAVLVVTAVLILVVVASAIGVLLFGQIPLIEGDRRVRKGSAYGFSIGMTREDALQVLQRRYADPDNDLRVVWEKGTSIDQRLARHENTDHAAYTARDHGEHRTAVGQVSHLSEPLVLCDEWRLELPARWVNDIYLTFRDGRLIEIQRSRWLFERP